MRHEVITETQEIPGGFESYSLLLIPDVRWLNNIGGQSTIDLFRRFQKFGETIGPHHLSAWLYVGGGFYGIDKDTVDVEVHSAVQGLLSSPKEADNYVLNGISYGKEVNAFHGGYDVMRAKYFCAYYGLNFNAGPYIAYFKDKPVVPFVYTELYRGRIRISEEQATKPSFLIRFGGMTLDDVISVLNDLEYEIIRGDPNVRVLELHQFARRLGHACQSVGDKLGKTVEIIKGVKEVLPIPSVKDII